MTTMNTTQGLKQAARALAAMALALQSGCAMIGASTNTDELRRTVGFDHSCAPEKVAIVSEDDGGMSGTGRYVVEACGSTYKYKRMGLSYYDAAKGLSANGMVVDAPDQSAARAQ